MFITKRKYENAINEAKREIAEQWERKLQEMDERNWRENETRRRREWNDSRFNDIERRILALEKETGLVKETPKCPCRSNEVAPTGGFGF